MSKRKNRRANNSQHGNWLKRYHKDGVLPNGRKRTPPQPTQKKQTKVIYIPSSKLKDFRGHKETTRLSKGIGKVQIEGLKTFIDIAKKDWKVGIIVSFSLKEDTIKWVKKEKYKISKPTDNKGILIFW